MSNFKNNSNKKLFLELPLIEINPDIFDKFGFHPLTQAGCNYFR